MMTVLPSLARLKRGDVPKPGLALQEIVLLKGESQGFLVHFTGYKQLGSITCSDTTGISFEVQRLDNLEISRPSGRFSRGDRMVSEGAGGYPDRLVPFKSEDFDPQGTMIYVEMKCDQKAPSGRFKIDVEAKLDGEILTKSLSVEILGSSFPSKVSYGTLVPVWNQKNAKVARLLAQHRISPGLPQIESIPPEAPIRAVSMGNWSGANIDAKTVKQPPNQATLRSQVSRVRGDRERINYTADEINNRPEFARSIREWAEALHREGIKNLVAMTPEPDYIPASGAPIVDIFASMASAFTDSRDAIAMAKESGSETWLYTATNQDAWSPKWLVDFPPAGYRSLCGAFSLRVGATGMVYWAADRWESNSDVAFHHPNGELYHGDGQIIYPSGIPSIRLKWIRDGIQDYEVLSRIRLVDDAVYSALITTVVGPGLESQLDPTKWSRLQNESRRAYAKLFPS